MKSWILNPSCFVYIQLCSPNLFFFKYYDKHVLSHTIKIDGDRRLFCDRMVIGFTPTLYQDAYQCPSLLKLCLHIILSDGVGWM